MWRIGSLLILVLAGLRGEGGSSADPFAEPLNVPLVVRVGLVGFDGDGGLMASMDPTAFKELLQNSLETVVPGCIETGEALKISHQIKYEVQHLSGIGEVEALIASNMRHVGNTDEDDRLFEIEVVDLEADLERYFDELTNVGKGHFGSSSNQQDGYDYPDEKTDETDNEITSKVMIIIMNPDKERMLAVPGNAGYFYTYRYKGGAATQLWVGRHRYLVVDISAGPVDYGSTEYTEPVASSTVPSLTVEDAVDDKATKQGQLIRPVTLRFRALIASVVIRAVHNIFASNIRFRSVDFAEQVIVPIVILRNHDRFDPFEGVDDRQSGSDRDFVVDVARIKQEVSKMLLPHQKLTLVTSMYQLHDHRHISTSIFKSVRSDTVRVSSRNGKLEEKITTYLDSNMLKDELEHVHDNLISSLLRSHGHHFSSLGDKEGAYGHDETSGHRVLPVFVFSLLSFPPDLLMDRTSLHLAGKDSVLVLQTGGEESPLPFMAQGERVFINPRRVTRHIIAGLATSLGGLTLPYERLEARSGGYVLTHDYLWANGNHPFGPFSNSLQLSQVYIDGILRNAIVARTDHAVSLVRLSSRAIFDFFEEFGISATEMAPFEKSSQGLNFTSAIAKGLLEERNVLQRRFRHLAQAIERYQLIKADRLSGSILLDSKAFFKYTETELESARAEMKCCDKKFTLDTSTTRVTRKVLQWLLVVVVGGVFFFVIKQSLGGESTIKATRRRDPSRAFRSNFKTSQD